MALLFVVWSFGSKAQIIEPYQPPVNPQWLTSNWKAFWITENSSTLDNFKVVHFRKTFSLAEKPDSFWVHVSADNAYQLFVNGHPVCSGPARGNTLNWYFETVNLAPSLLKGENTIAAVVWNFGKHAPNAVKFNVDYQLALILQGNSEVEQIANTDASWKVFVNKAYSPIPYGPASSVGSFERVDGSRYPWGWEHPEYDDSGWKPSAMLQRGYTEASSNKSWFDRVLKPRELPLINEELVRFKKIIRQSDASATTEFMAGRKSLHIASNSRFSMLLDNETLTTAYPELIYSGGKGASIAVQYAEALVDSDGKKGNRNEHKEKFLVGTTDSIVADGGSLRKFRPLWYRTYRFVQVDVVTGAEGLEISDFYGKFTAYPFYENAQFSSNQPQLNPIWDCAWRTARLCAHTTYMDCPFYEQLQYVGDTRIQALISLYVSGDDRLMRKALCDFNQSRFPNGLTCSAYPSRANQIIPPFSLFWNLMVDDYRMLRPDSAFCRSFESGIRQVLDWHLKFLNNDNMLENVPYWNFVDWPREWPWVDSLMVGGVPEGGAGGESSILTLQLAYTLERCSQMFAHWGLAEEAARYARIAEKVKLGTMKKCWDAGKGLLADSPLKRQFSQHANLWVPLCNLIPASEQFAFMNKVLATPELIECTLYYRFYLFEAMRKAGLSNAYLDNLAPWYTMIDLGLTTLAETPEPTRSDCHAWSASPLYHLLSLVAGIRPSAPGFSQVVIEPNPGSLTFIKAVFPHYKGFVKVDLKFVKGNVEGTVTLPEGLSGTFVWQGKSIAVEPGENLITRRL